MTGGDSSVFCQADERGKWKLKPGVSFHFFTSHTPCESSILHVSSLALLQVYFYLYRNSDWESNDNMRERLVFPGGDASIVPMTDSQAQPCPPVTLLKDKDTHAKGSAMKRKSEGSNKQEKAKLLRLEQQETAEGARDPPQSSLLNASSSETPSQTPSPQRDGAGLHTQVPDVYRTGAKCVPGARPDPLTPGEGYHTTGVLRVKPGRGERTLSLSCSDKLARWGVMGFQGALLSHYLQGALYFTSVVVGKCPYSQEAMHRALVTR